MPVPNKHPLFVEETKAEAEASHGLVYFLAALTAALVTFCEGCQYQMVSHVYRCDLRLRPVEEVKLAMIMQ